MVTRWSGRAEMCAQYLEYGDYGPQQRVKVLPVRHRVAGLRLQAELAAKDVHPQDAATHQQSPHML